ncbi:hypothetical protein NDU88_002418 [Pleurodeles waltl]|uniref:Uncharacterized protein n=1 Tax=Pleurodeles waltl TaxID=8319 RepID=A0AAV7RAY7_PLEWA|nr:hypothetical protein NDU88_002418 [Pleurodeles waltl]
MLRIRLDSGDTSRRQEGQDILRERTERLDLSSQPPNREMQPGQRPQRKHRNGERGRFQRKNPLQLHSQETKKGEHKAPEARKEGPPLPLQHLQQKSQEPLDQGNQRKCVRRHGGQEPDTAAGPRVPSVRNQEKRGS